MTIASTGIEETARLGRRLARALAAGDVVLLIGELGAGKTALTQAIVAGLDSDDEVSSPTFTLVNEYRGRLPIYHFDLYRLDDPAEAIDLGYDDYLAAGGISIIEWADRAPGLWPDEYLAIEIARTGETGRLFALWAEGAGLRQRLAGLLAGPGEWGDQMPRGGSA